MTKDRATFETSGFLMVPVLLVLLAFWAVLGYGFLRQETAWGVGMTMFLFALTALGGNGFVIVNPNEALVAQLFGRYHGTVKTAGFRWMHPFTTRQRVSLRIRNFESNKLKVNDRDGNPIEIAAVVVWRVLDSAEAIFEVEQYADFVHVQSEAAVRNLATSYPYDAHQEGETSLRGSTAAVAEKLQGEIQERLARAGVEVLESRISHLAYAPEIASAMLQRQQANAVVAARTRIVEGAVGIVEMALARLAEQHTVHLNEQQKAAVVSNLLVVLSGDRHVQPVVQAGTPTSS